MGTTTSQPDPYGNQTTADVNAILQGMTDASIDRIQQRRSQLPPQVQAGYQTPLPPQLGPTALQPQQPPGNLPTPQAQPPLPSLDTQSQQQAGILPPQLQPRQPPVQLQPPTQPQPPPPPPGRGLPYLPPQNSEQPPLRNMPPLWNGNQVGASGQTKQQFLMGRMMHESQGDPTALNYVARQNPRMYDAGFTASGLLQDTNTTWAQGVQWALADPQRYPMGGDDPRKYPVAGYAPWNTQWQVNSAIYDHMGETPWRERDGPAGAGFKQRLAGGFYDSASQPQQNLMPPIPRSYNEWGRPPPGFGMNQPGAMPQRNDFGRIMTAIAPLLLAAGSLALRMPLSTAITAYGAMTRAQQNGQQAEYQRNRTLWRDKAAESAARQTDESREAGDAFATYGNNNPQGLQQRLMEIALSHNDPDMYRAAERGDFDAIHRMQQQRDMYNQDLMKLHKSQDEEQRRQDIQADVQARDAQWDRENPGATPEQRAIAHAQHEGQAQGDVKAPGQGGDTEGPVLNVVDQNGKPTGQQVVRSKRGGYVDPNTMQPVQLKPGEQVEGVPRQRQAPAQPDIPPGWVKPGTKLPPPEPDQQDQQDQQSPAAAPSGGGGGEDQGEGGGGGDQDQGAATQAPPAADQTADQDQSQQPYQVAQAGPGIQPPPSQSQLPPPQAYPGPKYSPPDEMQQLGPTGDTTARKVFRGNENAVKEAPKQVQPLITAGADALQRQVDDVDRRAGLPEGDPARLAPNQIMPALRDIDPGYANDVDAVLRYDRAVPSGSGFGSQMSPFWNGITNLAHKIDNNWMPQNYDRVKEFTNQNQKTQATIQLTTTLASTGASVLRDVARIGKDFDSNAFTNAWNSFQAGKLEGDPRYTTLAADWQSFIIEANRLRTVSGSVVESEQQIGVLIPGQRSGGLLSGGVVPSNDVQFRDLIKNELANSYPKVQGLKEEWQALKPGVRMPGQAYIDKGDPTIQAILHMNPATGNYYGVQPPSELQGTGTMIPADPGDAQALGWAQSHPDDPKSLQIMQGLRQKGAF